MSGSANKLPKGWMNYTNMGVQLVGTRFIPMKTPLRMSMCKNKIPPQRWFTVQDVIDQEPRIKLIINLTMTENGRYYCYEDFPPDVYVQQISSAGHGTLPTTRQLNAFYQTVDDFIRAQGDSDALIGVHCTHGLNRTGYFICKYLIERMNMSPIAAIELFESARGHHIERQLYTNNLRSASNWMPNDSSSDSSLRPAPASASASSSASNQSRIPTGDRNRSRFDSGRRPNENPEGARSDPWHRCGNNQSRR